MSDKPIDDEGMESLLEEFREEHGRDPYASTEFARWWQARAECMATQIKKQLDMEGLEIVDGKIVKRESK